jgi:regulator of RNase E activity RraA
LGVSDDRSVEVQGAGIKVGDLVLADADGCTIGQP